MGAVNHDGLLLALLRQRLLGLLHVLLVKVGAVGAASQDDEAVLVALGARDGSQALLRDTHEMVLRRRGANSINGNTKIAVGAVLEADGEGQTAGELAVQLALCSAGANGADADEVGEELRGDGVEHLAGDGHAGGGEVAEEGAADAQALVDLEGGIDVRVVDEALPADGGAGLLEVGAHDDAEVAGEAGGDVLEAGAVLEGGGGVVDGAGPDDDEEAVVLAHDDVGGLVAAADDGLQGRVRHGDLGGEEGGRDEGVLAQDCRGGGVLAIADDEVWRSGWRS